MTPYIALYIVVSGLVTIALLRFRGTTSPKPLLQLLFFAWVPSAFLIFGTFTILWLVTPYLPSVGYGWQAFAMACFGGIAALLMRLSRFSTLQDLSGLFIFFVVACALIAASAGLMQDGFYFIWSML